MYSLGEIRPGQAIQIDGIPFLVTEAQHKKQARGAGVLKTILKNLKTGATIPKTFQGNEKIQPAEVGFFRAQFLYRDGDNFEFMRSDNFENFFIAQEILGEDYVFLKEGEEFDIQHFEGNPISINFPPSMTFKVIETPPGVRGDTASGGTKPAKLENGISVQVPFFVEENDEIQIDTRTQEFQKRV